MSRTSSAVSTACASLSMTHGPAMSTSGPPPPMLTLPMSTREGPITPLPGHRRGRAVRLRELVLVARFDESGEQRVRLQRLRLELGMELHRHVPRMRGQLDNLDELPVERSAHDLEALLGQRALVEAVELVAMTVPLVDQIGPVQCVRFRARLELALVRSEPHRPAEIVDAQQVAKLVDDVRLRVGRALRRV